jgi:hypothetical protein
MINPVAIQLITRRIDFDIGRNGNDAAVGLFPKSAQYVQAWRRLPLKIDGQRLILWKYETIPRFVEYEVGSSDSAARA